MARISFANDLDAYERQLRSYFVLYFTSSSIKLFWLKPTIMIVLVVGVRMQTKRKVITVHYSCFVILSNCEQWFIADSSLNRKWHRRMDWRWCQWVFIEMYYQKNCIYNSIVFFVFFLIWYNRYDEMIRYIMTSKIYFEWLYNNWNHSITRTIRSWKAVTSYSGIRYDFKDTKYFFNYCYSWLVIVIFTPNQIPV